MRAETRDATSAHNPPDWIADVRRKYTLRITDWVTQSWALTVAPGRFMAEWAEGQREALNPLRFLAVATAVSVLAERLSRRVLSAASAPSGWVEWLQTSLGSTLIVLLLGSLMHLTLRWKSKVPLRSTLAATIYTVAGPGTFLGLLGWIVSCAWHLAGKNVPNYSSAGIVYPWPVMIASWASFGWTMFALGGVHRVRWWWSFLSLLALPVILAVVSFGIGIVIVLLHVPLPAGFPR